MREKNDKFQQRRLDGFFKAGLKACDEACAAEEPAPPHMPEVQAMEVEMEVCSSAYPAVFFLSIAWFFTYKAATSRNGLRLRPPARLFVWRSLANCLVQLQLHGKQCRDSSCVMVQIVLQQWRLYTWPAMLLALDT